MNNRKQVSPVSNIDLVFQKITELGIKTRKCINHIPSEDKPLECGCGKELLARDTEANKKVKKNEIMNQNEKYDQFWSREKCTIPDKLTDAFGEIKFIGANENTAKYIRVEFETDMHKMIKVLNDVWAINRPRLIISVTGGAKITLKPRLRETFSKSLVKVATTTNALITTGGSYSGCMKLVGEAFKDNALALDEQHNINILGIANWGSVTNNYKLINNEKNVMQKEYELVKPKSKIKTELLDPNHTHFILVDDTTNKFGGEVDFRTSLEAKISSHYDNIPIVVLVVGGGPRTAKTVLGSIRKDSPCVFLESSGESSDIFVFALRRMEELRKIENKTKKNIDKSKEVKTEFKLDPEFREEIKAKFKSEYSAKNDEEINKMVDIMQSCLDPKYKHLLTVCPSNNLNAQIDLAILNALLQAVKQEDNAQDNLTSRSIQKKSFKKQLEPESSKYQKQLHLALDWNRADIARKFIFTDELSDKIGPLNDLMYRAINENRIEFVKLFLEKGFSIKNFLTYRVMLKLYNSIPENSSLYRILHNYKKGQVKFELNESASFVNLMQNRTVKNIYTFKNIGFVIQFLAKDLFQHKFTQQPFSIIDNSYCDKILNDTDDFGKMMPQTIGIFNDIENKSRIIDIDRKFSSPELELFIYCILLGRSEMGKLFCSIGNDSICSALVAKTIFQSLSKLFEETSGFYKNLSEEYEEFAHDLLNAYYTKDEEIAKFTLIRKIEEYDNITCMQLAVGSNCLSIMAHQCFQNVLNKIWYNKIQPDFSFFKFALSVLFPPAAPLLLTFQKEKIKYEQIDEESSIERVNDFDNEFEFVLKRTPSEDLENAIKLEESFYLKKLFYFITTPYVKFVYFQAFYLLFLLLFSYILLCDFYPIGHNMYSVTSPKIPISALEVLLIIWVGTFLIDEIRAFNVNEMKVFRAKFKNLVKNMWNLADYIAIFLFIVGLILRFIPNSYECYLTARVLWCIDIIVWFFKSLYAYTLNRNLGPKLLMIKKMLPQLGYFLLIVVLFMFAFGVSTHSLMYHNSNLNSKLLSDVFFPAFWVIGGEYYTRDLIMSPDPPNCNAIDSNDTYIYSYGPDDCPNKVGANVSLAIYVLYLILLDILLVNLLIAIFNNTYENIETQANKISKSQRYSIVFEFYYKPILPPPFVIISYFGSLIGYVIGVFRRNFITDNKHFRRKDYFNRFFYFISKKRNPGFVYEFTNEIEKNKIAKWEAYNTDEYVYTKEKEIEKTVEFKLDQNVQKLDSLCFKFDELIDNQKKDDLNKKIENLSTNLEKLYKLISNDLRK